MNDFIPFLNQLLPVFVAFFGALLWFWRKFSVFLDKLTDLKFEITEYNHQISFKMSHIERDIAEIKRMMQNQALNIAVMPHKSDRVITKPDHPKQRRRSASRS